MPWSSAEGINRDESRFGCPVFPDISYVQPGCCENDLHDRCGCSGWQDPDGNRRLQYARDTGFDNQDCLCGNGFRLGFSENAHSPTLPFKEGYVDWRGDVWRQPTDPARWLKYSVVWFSQVLAHELGEKRLERYASEFGFGNADFTGDPGKNNGLDRAWISSSLKISPEEQVTFLRKLVNRILPVAPDVFDKVYESVEMTSLPNGLNVHGKTGSAFPRKADGSFDRARAYGWFVGWASKGDRTLVFARLEQNDKEGSGGGGNRVRESFLKELPALADSLLR